MSNRNVFILILALAGSGRLSALTLSHSSSADFAAGSSDAQVEVNGGSVVLSKAQSGALGTWASTATLPLALHDMAVWTTDDAIYVAGGNSLSTLQSTVYSAVPTGPGTLGVWSNKGSLGRSVQGAGVAVWRDWVYVAGGTGSGGVPSINLARAKMSASGGLSSFSDIAPLPVSVFAGVLKAEYGYLIYLHTHQNSSFYTDNYTAPIRADGSIGAWTLQAGAPRPQNYTDGLAIRALGRIFSVGGENLANMYASGASTLVGSDGSLAAWVAESSLTTISSYYVAGQCTGYGRAYAVGGRGGFPTPYAKAGVESAPLTSSGLGSFAADTALPVARAFGGMQAWKGRAWYFGGVDTGLTSQSAIYTAPISTGAANSPGGVFESGFDCGQEVSLAQLSWNATSSANVAIQVRVAGADGVFGAWSTASSSSPISLSGLGRYVEYRVVFSDPGSGSTASLDDVALTYAPQAEAVSTPGSGYLVHDSLGDFATGSSDGQFELSNGSVILSKAQSGPLGPWSATASLPVPLHDMAVWTSDDAIYVAGGNSLGTLQSTAYSATLTGPGSLSAWSNKGSLGRSVQGAGVAVWRDWVYVAGGTGSGGVPTINLARAKMSASGGLSSFSDIAPLPVSVFAGVLKAEYGYLIYLHTHQNSSFYTDNYTAPIRADGSIGAWTLQAGAPRPQNYTDGLAIRALGRIFSVGGENLANMYASGASTLVGSDGSLAAWVAEPSLTSISSYYVAGQCSGYGRAYAVGGRGGFPTPYAKAGVESAPLTSSGLGSFAADLALPVARAFGGVQAWKGRAWYLGGVDTGLTSQSAIYTAPILTGQANSPGGVYESSFDLGTDCSLIQLSWNATSSSSLSLQARVAPATGVFGAWSSPSSSSPLPLAGSGRYVEYRVAFSDPGLGISASLDQVRVDFLPPTPTATPTTSATPTQTATATPSVTASVTGTRTATASFTVSSSATPTATPSATVSATYTESPTLTASPSSNPTPDTAATAAPDAPADVRAFPNPVRGETLKEHFAFRMAEAGHAKLTVWNSAGQVVANVDDDLGAGPALLALTVRGLAPGVYLYQLELTYASGGKVTGPVKKMVKY